MVMVEAEVFLSNVNVEKLASSTVAADMMVLVASAMIVRLEKNVSVALMATAMMLAVIGVMANDGSLYTSRALLPLICLQLCIHANTNTNPNSRAIWQIRMSSDMRTRTLTRSRTCKHERVR